MVKAILYLARNFKSLTRLLEVFAEVWLVCCLAFWYVCPQPKLPRKYVYVSIKIWVICMMINYLFILHSIIACIILFVNVMKWWENLMEEERDRDWYIYQFDAVHWIKILHKLGHSNITQLIMHWRKVSLPQRLLLGIRDAIVNHSTRCDQVSRY